MEHYTKVSGYAAEGEEKKEVYDIHVKSGSKIKNIISQAYRLLKNKEEEKIVLTGSGPTVTKTITCAEIIKRKSKSLHQLNKLFYTNIQDTWEPKEESLDKYASATSKMIEWLQVTRKVPSITITLSKVPLDAALPGYQAPGKSKSPVQFGDEDWELAWDESQDNSTKTTQKAHQEQKAKAKRKSKGFVDKGNAETKTINKETSNKGANSEKDADQGHLRDNICTNKEGHPEGKNLETEHRQAEPLRAGDLQGKQSQRLEATDLDDKQSCEGVLGGGVFEDKQRQGVHHDDSVLNNQNNGCQQVAGVTLGRKQSCKGNQKVAASQSIHVGQVQGGTGENEEHLDLGELKIQQIQEHLKGGALESQKTGDRYLTRDMLGSTESHVGYLGEVVESAQGYSNGSQWTEGAPKRRSNNGSLKTKPSPTKKQKA